MKTGYICALLSLILCLASISNAEVVNSTVSGETASVNVANGNVIVNSNTDQLEVGNSTVSVNGTITDETAPIQDISEDTLGVIPILECIMVDSSSGQTMAYFGFSNESDSVIDIPVGDENRFYPEPMERSQTVEFTIGRSLPYPVAAFSVESSEDSYIWSLNRYEVSVSPQSPKCRTSWLSFYIAVSVPHESNQLSQQQLGRIISFTSDSLNVPRDHLSISVNKTAVDFKVSYYPEGTPGDLNVIFVTISQASQANTTQVINPADYIKKLFKNNRSEYDKYVDGLYSFNLNVVEVRPTPTGLELFGTRAVPETVSPAPIESVINNNSISSHVPISTNGTTTIVTDVVGVVEEPVDASSSLKASILDWSVLSLVIVVVNALL